MASTNETGKVSGAVPKNREPSATSTARRRSTKTQIMSSIKPHQPEIEDVERKKCHKMFLTFLGQPGIEMCLSLMKFLAEESNSKAVQILRFNSETKNLRFNTQSYNVLPNHQDLSLENCQLFSNVMKNKHPVLLSKKNRKDAVLFNSTRKQLSQIFTEIPTSILMCKKVPKSLTDLQFSIDKLCQCINILVPFVMKTQESEDSATLVELQTNVLKSLDHTEFGDCLGDRSKMLAEVASQLKTLVDCESIVLFLVDTEGSKLIPHYMPEFCPKMSDKSCPHSMKHDTEGASVEFAVSQELYWVVKNNMPLRVNALSDCKEYGIRVKRKEIHTQGGCVVRNFMCAPITESSGKLPLIVEMINKDDGFTTQDEYKVMMYAKYASPLLTSSVILAHRGKMKKRSAIFDEVVRNIVPLSNEQVHQLHAKKYIIDDNFKNFSYCLKNTAPKEMETSAAILFIFTDLGLLSRWNMHRTTVVRFILCVQQSYRDVPYHNWMHAFSVTHFAYALVTTLKLVEREYLSDLEVLALIVSCICHDVDHRGFNNHFQLCTQSFLYTLYKQDDSIMERHHLSVALAILSREDCNIVEYLNENDYRNFIQLLSWNILATDIGKHMRCRDELFETMQSFDKTNIDHRMTLLSCCMTMCDLCDTTKNWDDNLLTVKKIFTEFFNQGDEEKKMGWKPASMMDRKHAYIPDAEIKFLQYVCRPVYYNLAQTFPPIQNCVDTIDHEIELWYLSTEIFDKNSGTKDPLVILDLPEMKEDALWKSYSQQYAKQLRGRRYTNIGGGPSKTSLKTFRIKELKDIAHKAKENADEDNMSKSNAPNEASSQENFKEDVCSWCCCK